MNFLLKYKKIILPLLIIFILFFISFIIFITKKSDKTIESYSEYSNYTVSNDIADGNILEVTITSNEINEVEITNSTSENTVENTVNNSQSNSSQNNNSSYYIKVNYTANVVTIYTKDTNGNYTVPVKAMVCSTGTSTPRSGVYKIPGRWQWGALFGGVYGQYVTKITGNILFHSVPYLQSRNPASLEYWEYDKLGTSASAGCVRLTVADALWIYKNCPNGTQVEFYSSNNPGPLGKPSAQKISSYGAPYYNWDPTDPDSRNPWKTTPPSTNNSNSSNVDSSITNNTQISNNTTNTEHTTDNINNNTSSNNTVNASGNTSIENNTNINVEDNTSANQNIANNVINSDVSNSSNSSDETLLNDAITNN